MGSLDTKTLIGLKKKVRIHEGFFLARFFRAQVNFPTAEVAFDKIKKGVKLAPFVSPMVAGKPNRKAGGQTVSMEPAYVKPHDIVRPKDLIKRVPGEDFDGTMDLSQRRIFTVLNLLDEQEESITAREEWMAVQAVLHGSVVIEGEDYPTQLVEFGRNDANNIALVGAAKWDTVDPETYDVDTDLENWADLSDVVCDMLTFDKSTWSRFKQFKMVKDNLETRRGSKSEVELGPQLSKTVQFKGWYGDFACYVYKGKYEESDGTEKPYLDTGRLLLSPSENDDVRCYGAIQDAKAIAEGGLVAKSRHAKNWFTDDPSVENLQTQSAPLMACLNADDYVSVSTFQ